MKLSSIWISAALLLGALPASALEAIPSYQGGQTVALAPGGAGFGFSPKLDITVTALGSGTVVEDGEPGTASLWDSNGQLLVSVLVTANSPQVDWARYATIPPVRLAAGQTYYASFVETNGDWLGHVLWGSGANSNGTFTVGAGLSYLGAGLGTNASGSFPQQFYATNMIFIGPNFLYATNTFLVINGIRLVSGQVQIPFGVSGAPVNSFTLLESSQPNGLWTTNQAAVLTTNTPGVAYTFTTPTNGPVRFYRVRSP